MFTTFDQVKCYMERFTNLEKQTDLYSSRTYRLDRMRLLMQRLGNPQDSYRTIHVAGSKGKGSTAALVANGLKALGHRVGLYMSPHVTDYRERFTLCQSFADEKTLVETGNLLESMLGDFQYQGNPTTFELYTAFAFLLFKQMNCDYAVIETGLGGRLDATNVIDPIASIITPIELEHTNLLGNTIREIATEKSKIIKHTRPVFISNQTEEAMKVFENEAQDCQSRLYSLEKSIERLETDTHPDGQHVHVVFKELGEYKYTLSLCGKVQAYNSALAIIVLKTLGLFDEEKTIPALEKVTLPGRMECLEIKERRYYLDGAHTPSSMKNLLESFTELYPKDGICIFGCVSDKNHTEMAEEVLRRFDTVVISRPGTFKKSDLSAVFEAFENLRGKDQTVVLLPEAKDALSYIENNTEKTQPVLVCGSFYLAGTIREALCET